MPTGCGATRASPQVIGRQKVSRLPRPIPWSSSASDVTCSYQPGAAAGFIASVIGAVVVLVVYVKVKGTGGA